MPWCSRISTRAPYSFCSFMTLNFFIYPACRGATRPEDNRAQRPACLATDACLNAEEAWGSNRLP